MQSNLQTYFQDYCFTLMHILSGIVFDKRFGFLFNSQIHGAMVIAQEGIHTIKTQKLPIVNLNIDLSKAYDRVN